MQPPLKIFCKHLQLDGAHESAYLRKWIFTNGDPLFETNLKDHVLTVHGNVRVKFEVCSFNRFKLVWLTANARPETSNTSNEHIIAVIHFVKLAEIKPLSFNVFLEKPEQISAQTLYFQKLESLPKIWAAHSMQSLLVFTQLFLATRNMVQSPA